jgi:hypothetical protein
MLRTILATAFATASTAAMAHPGHIADVGQGHSHFTAISALVIVAIATTFALKQRFFS